MSHQNPVFSVVYRLTISVIVAALTLTTLGSNVASARYITTVKDWTDGNAQIGVGCNVSADATTFGQVVTIPHRIHSMYKFRFELSNDPKVALGSMVVRGEVYAWDGTKASGSALWETKPRTISFADYAFQKIVFQSGYVPVTPGQQYVVFASIDKDYGACVSGSWFDVGGPGSELGDLYPEGYLAYQKNGGDATQWTTSNWTIGYQGTADLAFSVRVNH